LYHGGQKSALNTYSSERSEIKRMNKVGGIYVTSDQMAKGHVGLNKVNPVLNKIRNMEKKAATTIQMYWKNSTYSKNEGEQQEVLYIKKSEH